MLISFIEQEKVTPANPAQILGPFPNSVIDRRYLVVLLLWLWSGFIMFYWFFLTSSWCVVDLLLTLLLTLLMLLRLFALLLLGFLGCWVGWFVGSLVAGPKPRRLGILEQRSLVRAVTSSSHMWLWP